MKPLIKKPSALVPIAMTLAILGVMVFYFVTMVLIRRKKLGVE